MAVEKLAEGGGFVVTGEHIQTYQFLACRRALALEIRTGMVMSRGVSWLQLAQRMGWTDKRTKKGALADMNKIAQEMGLDPVEV